MSAPSIVPGTYRHSKSGRLYRVHFVAKHSETLEDLVVYETLYENSVAKYWVRPAMMFTEAVEVGGQCVPRFVRVSPSEAS